MIGWIETSYMFCVFVLCFSSIDTAGGLDQVGADTRVVKVKVRGGSFKIYPIYSSGGLNEW